MGIDGDVVRELRRPLPPQSIGFKLMKNPQQRDGKFSQGQMVAFIDARTAAARLNYVVPGWEDEYVSPPVGKGLMCRLTVEGVTRCDVGFSNSTDSDIGIKSLYSDAFKRAAVKFEVGAFLYALPRTYVKPEALKQYGAGDKLKWFVPDNVVAGFRREYQAWAESQTAFGAILDHGDAENPQGDPESHDDQTVPEDEQPVKVHLPDFYEFVRTAIRAKEPRAWKDAAWDKEIAEAKRAGDDALKVFGGKLLGQYTELGGDADDLRERYRVLKAQAA